MASGGGQDLASKAEDIQGIKVLAARLDGADSKTIRNTIDQLRDKLGEAVVVLGSGNGEKSKLVAGVSQQSNRSGSCGQTDQHTGQPGRAAGAVEGPTWRKVGIPEDKIGCVPGTGSGQGQG